MLNRPGNDLQDLGTCSNKDCECNTSGICYLAVLCNERFCAHFKIEDCFRRKDWTLNNLPLNSPIIHRKVINAILELNTVE